MSSLDVSALPLDDALTVAPALPGEPARWLPRLAYLRSLLSPLLTLSFLLLSPGPWWLALSFLLAPFALDALAAHSPEERRQPPPAAKLRRFDLLLAALFVLHWVNLVLALRLTSAVGWGTLTAPVAVALLVISSSISGGVVGHELIHRPGALARLCGRLTLCTLLYEHFFTDHLRGHHARVGNADDPSTARRGEALWPFLARTVPGQLVNAWRLERRRLARRAWCWRVLGHRVLQGLLLEATLLVGCALWFGAPGLASFLVQAVAVQFLYQVVIYFEHWGLARDPEQPARHSWDTTNRSTLFSMVGLARHADHHIMPARPFHELRYHEQSPKLPRGYGGMIWLAVARNREYQRLMLAELERRQIAPPAALRG